MIKQILKLTILVVGFFYCVSGNAQMPEDGFTMSKNELCTVVGFRHAEFTQYWEGTRLRENLNMGTLKTTAFMPMLGYGITNRINLFAGLPYIETNSTKGNMTGKKGWQDFSMAVKYQAITIAKKNFNYKLFATAGFSLPATNYVPDFLPYSIGIGSKTASLRLVNHLVFYNHFFTTVQGGYTFRSNIKVDRITYYTDGQHYSNEMRIPNVWDGSFKLGYNNPLVRASLHYNISNSIDGSDIRRNDMPYPGNEMDIQAVGADLLLWVPWVKGLAVTGRVDQVVAGRNVGKTFSWMTGLQYVFKPFSQKKKSSSTNEDVK